MATDKDNENGNLNKQREDPLAPTDLDHRKTDIPYNKNSNEPSHLELQSRLEVYSRIGGEMDQFVVFQELKAKYMDETESLEFNRVKQDVNLAHGIRTGLPNHDFSKIKQSRDSLDQNKRNDMARIAKDRYMEINSLSKEFTSTGKKPDINLRDEFEMLKKKYDPTPTTDKDIDKDR
ncbi:hypothetical protein GC194_04960 [bacterium]|nr:hypothetical protein [bacterium]